jgi:hypothetical protein
MKASLVGHLASSGGASIWLCPPRFSSVRVKKGVRLV